MVAAGLGFLWYNTFPAQIFMGDIARWRSAECSDLCRRRKHEILLVVAGGVFVVEALSVIYSALLLQDDQEARLPHGADSPPFELKGWAEQKIVVRPG